MIRHLDTRHLTQVECAELFGVHRSRIQQLELRALRKMRAAIEAEAQAAGVTISEWLEGAEVVKGNRGAA